MHELVCLCGGCQRESLHQCKCAFAKQDRCTVLKLLAEHKASQEKLPAFEYVKTKFVERYGKRVLATPQSSLSWLFPFAAICGGLALLFGLGRRWVRRGEVAMGNLGAASPTTATDEEYADRLDDELRETD